MAGRAWLDSTEEYAVTVAASLAGRFLEEGRNVGLIASGAHLETIPADRSDRQLVKMLESLAVVRADGALRSPSSSPSRRRLGRHDFMTVITPSLDERWVAALAEIAQRGVRVSAVLIEPGTFGSAPSPLLTVSALAAAGIPAHLVKYGEPIASAFASPAHNCEASVASLAIPCPPRLARAGHRRGGGGMRPAEGWASVILLGIVLLCTAWTVARTDVAPDGVSMAVLAVGGLLTGLGLAKLSTPDLLAHLFAILSGVFASLLLAVERMPLALGGRWARLGALGDLGAQWLAQAQAGDPLDDPRLLSIMLGAAVWLVSTPRPGCSSAAAG